MEIIFNKVCYKNKITKKFILKDISFKINDGINAFIGPSGSGKTTILKLLETMIFPDLGTIKINGFISENKNKSLDKLREEIGIVYQNPQSQFFKNTVKEEITFALTNYNYKEKEKTIKETIKLVGLNNNYLDRNPFELSSSEQMFLSLAISLAFQPKILILDRPFKNLDNKNKEKIIKLLKMLKYRYKKTIIISDNDTDSLFKISDKIFIINRGKLVEEGNKNDILGNLELLKKYDINIPKTVNFTHLVMEKTGKNIGIREEINDLIKDVYRHVK
ncbi:MAG: energy-coupling factor ABC transporter ATP-binding protein [Bacilli bacterium]|nr:energy-coupling factor ABC transporter ATP-binding protein [Bacilli bacterium]MBR3363209.1 energy-coupling factor ABC transporter ATP-binding protein [Bacilli bacterium]